MGHVDILNTTNFQKFLLQVEGAWSGEVTSCRLVNCTKELLRKCGTGVDRREAFASATNPGLKQ